MQQLDPQVAEILDRLVAFDTVSHKTNLPLLGFVSSLLRDRGIEPHLIPDASGDKANLFATIGPEADQGGIGLSGHTDVVPVTDQAWDTDPFQVVAKDGRYYGRGTADMKGFLACVLAAVPLFQAQKLKRPIHILFSYDEEVGCTGVRPMADELGKRLPLPEIIFVGEPTNMTVVDAHKGPTRWNVEITGHAAHSSMAHLGANAIHAAAELIAEIQRIGVELEASLRDERFDPPTATLQVTTITGGTASNIIPLSCSFGFEVRALPGVDVDAIENRIREHARTRVLPSLRSVSPDTSIAIDRINHVPPFAARSGSKATALGLHLAGGNETFAVSYATEAGILQEPGSDTVVIGPGDIAQAHTANEWVAESELVRCTQFLDRLAEWASS